MGDLLLQFVLPCFVKGWNSFSHFQIALLEFTKLKLYSSMFCMSWEIEMLITRQVKLYLWTFTKVSRSFCFEATVCHFITFMFVSFVTVDTKQALWGCTWKDVCEGPYKKLVILDWCAEAAGNYTLLIEGTVECLYLGWMQYFKGSGNRPVRSLRLKCDTIYLLPRKILSANFSLLNVPVH